MWLINETIKLDGKIYRVLHTDSSELVWIDIHHPRARPQLQHILNLESNFSADSIQRVEDPFDYLKNVQPPDGSIACLKRNEAYKTIQNLVIDTDCFDPKIRSRKAQAVAIEKSKSLAMIYKYLRRYWQRGQIPNALLPDYKNCGARGTNKAENSGRKVGPKRRYSNSEGIKITPEIQTLFQLTIDANLLTTKTRTIPRAYREFLVLFKKEYPQITPANYPTLKQFKYFYYKNSKPKDRVVAQTEKGIYQKDVRPTHSTATANVFGPGHRYEIDATIADIYLVADDDKEKVIGRPTIYVVIDVFSRMVTGFYIGFQNASYVVAMKALVSAFTDKVEYCKKYGVEIEQEAWPCIGLPTAILADRGELRSNQVEYFTNALNISIETAPPRRGDAKGIVERYFKTIHAEFEKFTPGAVTGSKIKKHGEEDYRVKSAISFSKFKEAIISSILYRNNFHVMEKYDPDPEMPSDIPPIAREIWNWGIENKTGRLKQIQLEKLKVAVLPREKASLSENGIKLFGLYYTSAELIRSGYLLRSKQINRPQNLEAAYDPDSCDTIYLFPDKDSLLFWTCHLADRSRKYRGLTFWSAWKTHAEGRKTEEDYKQQALEERMKLEEKNKILLRGSKPTKSLMSNAQKIAKIKQNKKEAIDSERQAGAKTNNPRTTVPKAEVIEIGKEREDYTYQVDPDDLFNNE